MNLTVLEVAPDSLEAAYDCPCGCHPSVRYQRHRGVVHDGCCCGNEFAVGSSGAERLDAREGFRLESRPFAAPWGEPLEATWSIGPSIHDDAPQHDHHHQEDPEMHSMRPLEMAHGGAGTTMSAQDPVCGMTVDPGAARAKGLHSQYKGIDYFFCSKGCKLDFDEDPERYLDPSYAPSM